MDIVDKTTRSRMMLGIRSKDTKPEVSLRKALHKLGFRYRLHHSRLPGKPDLVFKRFRSVVFVHGCFWHRHSGCKYTTTPATRPDFWQKKFIENVDRDRRNLNDLNGLGWRCAVIWECAIRRDLDSAANSVANWLVSGEEAFLEFP